MSGYLYVYVCTPEDGASMPPCPECGQAVDSTMVEVRAPEPMTDGLMSYYSPAEGDRRYLVPCGCDMAGVLWLVRPPVLVPA